MAKNRGVRVEPLIYRRESGGFFVRLRRKSGEICRVVQTLSDARLLKRQLTMAKNGVAIGGKDTVLLKDILDAYAKRLADQGKPNSSVLWINAKMVKFFGEYKQAPLTEDDMEAWASHAHADYVRRGIVTLRTAHRRAKLPVPTAPEYEYEPGHRLIVPEEQARAFFAELPWGSPERATAEIMLLTAARLTHVLQLRVNDTLGPFLIIRSRKGRGLNRVSIEEHPITDRLRKVLDSVVPPNAPRDRHVIQIDGHPIEDGSLRKRLLAASRRAKITPEIGSLAWVRNFTITRLIENGASIDVVSRMAGHANISTTRKHYDKAKLLKARMAASEAMEATVGTGPHQKPTEVNEVTPICAVAEADPLQVVDPNAQTPN